MCYVTKMKPNRSVLCLSAMVLCLLIKESLPLRIISVSVPEYRIRGQSAQLECEYELGRDRLYSVKWYRDNEEFYRYIPKYDPPKHAYKLDGIKVDLGKSDDKKVWLHAVTLKSTGVYRCEVSAEAPSFASAAGEGRMEVIYLPREGPRITGNELENRRTDMLFLNCTSGRSYPAAVLSWDIDGQKVTDPSMLVEYGATAHAHGLLSTALGLRVPPARSMQVTDPSMLVEYGATAHAHGLLSTALGLRVPPARSMQVRCVARVAPAWPGQGSAAVVGGVADSKEAMLLVRSGSNKLSSITTRYLIINTLLCIVYSYISFKER